MRTSNAQATASTDPTANVLDLVHAQGQFRDVLREADLRHQRETERHLREMLEQERRHNAEMHRKEEARVNAVFQATQEVGRRDAEATKALAASLAHQVDASKESANAALQAAVAPLQGLVDELRKWQWEAGGARTHVTETQAKGASVGLWVGIAAAAVVGLGGLFMTALSIAVMVILQLN